MYVKITCGVGYKVRCNRQGKARQELGFGWYLRLLETLLRNTSLDQLLAFSADSLDSLPDNSLTKLYFPQDRGVIDFQLLDLAERGILIVFLFIIAIFILTFLHHHLHGLSLFRRTAS